MSKDDSRDEQAKRRRRRRRLVIAAIAAVLAYPVLGTLALWTGFVEWLVRSEDLRVVIDNPAYTIWPGRIHMKRVGVYVNGDSQFTLEGNDLVAKVRFLPMVKKKFHVTELRANGVVYRMRTQVDTTRGIEKRVAAFPPLPELPGANVMREKDAEQTEPRESPWTVQVDGIEIGVSELWFLEYRYVGDGTLTGSFLIGPNRMRVGTSVQDLGPGELRFGAEHVFVENFGGKVEATIPEINPKEHADQGFLDFVTARVRLGGDIRSLGVLGAYAAKLEVKRGAGPFRADITLDKGWLGKDSFVRYQTKDLRVTSGEIQVKTDWKLDVGVSALERQQNEGKPERELPHVKARAESTYLLVGGRSNRSVSVGVHDHEQDIRLKSRQIGSMLALEHARAKFPNIVTEDLKDARALMPPDSPVRLKKGAARASLTLDVDDEYVVRGPLRVNASDLELDAAGVALSGKAYARAKFTVDLKSKTSTVRDVALKLWDVSMDVGDEHVDDWWIAMSTKRVRAWDLPPRRLDTRFAIRAKDAEPVLEALAEKDKLNDLIAKFTSLDDLTATVDLEKKGKLMDVTLASESDVWDIAGRIYSDGKRNLMAVVVGGQAVSIGVSSDGKNTEIEPFAKTEWLNERLRRFPKPVKQLRPDKP